MNYLSRSSNMAAFLEASSLPYIAALLVLFCTYVNSAKVECYECEEQALDTDNPKNFECLNEAFDPALLKQGRKPNVPIVKCPDGCVKVFLSNYGIVDGQKVLLTRSVRRGCRTADHGLFEYDGCKYVKGSQGESYQCSCQDDYCNAASYTKMSPVLAILISFAVYLLKF